MANPDIKSKTLTSGDTAEKHNPTSLGRFKSLTSVHVVYPKSNSVHSCTANSERETFTCKSCKSINSHFSVLTMLDGYRCCCCHCCLPEDLLLPGIHFPFTPPPLLSTANLPSAIPSLELLSPHQSTHTYIYTSINHWRNVMDKSIL